MTKVLVFLFLMLTACSSPAENIKQEYTYTYNSSTSVMQMSSLENHLERINETLINLSKLYNKGKASDAQLLESGLAQLKLISGEINRPNQKWDPTINDITTTTSKINSNLDEIKKLLEKINTNLPSNANSNYWAEAIKTLSPIFAGYFIFVWGLMNLAVTEARAKMNFITPLIDKSSKAITDAYEAINNGSSLNHSDITKIIEPIVRIKPFLKERNFIEAVLETNLKTFELMKMCLPSDITAEVENKELLNRYLNPGVNSTTNPLISTTLLNQYKSAKDDVLNFNKDDTPSDIKYTRKLIIIFTPLILIAVSIAFVIHLK